MRRHHNQNSDLYITVHLLVTNGNFVDSNYWIPTEYASITVSNNEYTINPTTGFTSRCCNGTPLVTEALRYHIIYICFEAKTNQNTKISVNASDVISTSKIVGDKYMSESDITKDFTRFSGLRLLTGTITPYFWFNLRIHTISLTIKNVMAFDLTADFGAGNEPTQAEFDAILNEKGYLPTGENRIKI